jgi:hypothetical protein
MAFPRAPGGMESAQSSWSADPWPLAAYLPLIAKSP